MVTSKEKVLALLTSLPKADLEAVQSVIASLLGAQGANLDPVTALVFEAISGALNGPTGALTLGAMPSSLQKALADKAPGLISFFDEHFKGWNKSKTLQILFVREMLLLLHNDLVAIGVKPTYKTMIFNLYRMPIAFETAFPEYLHCGLGSVFLKRLRNR